MADYFFDSLPPFFLPLPRYRAGSSRGWRLESTRIDEGVFIFLPSLSLSFHGRGQKNPTRYLCEPCALCETGPKPDPDGQSLPTRCRRTLQPLPSLLLFFLLFFFILALGKYREEELGGVRRQRGALFIGCEVVRLASIAAFHPPLLFFLSFFFFFLVAEKRGMRRIGTTANNSELLSIDLYSSRRVTQFF